MATKSYSTKTLVATLIFMLYATFNVVDAGLFRRPVINVLIRNRLEGSKNLTLHCKSKNDDLGIKFLLPHESWSFKFRPNVFGGTLFHCRFMWNGISYRNYDVYKQGRDEEWDDNTTICYNIISSGPCSLCPPNGDLVNCQKWKPNHPIP